MSEHDTRVRGEQTAGPRDHGTGDELSVRGGQWAVVSGLSSTRQLHGGFSLAELLVTMGVLVLLVLLFTRLINSAASITTLGHTQIGTDVQARQLLDRMAIDFEQMVKRSDVDYYLKSSAIAPLRRVLQPGNDKIGFYTTALGYYPVGGSQSPVSLVSYRVNAQNRLERMGKGLLWNGSTPTSGSTPPSVVFMPIPLASPLPVGELPFPTPNPIPTPAWKNVADLTVSPTPDPDTEIVGPQVFRFEYYYLVRGKFAPGAVETPIPTPAPPILTDIPWDTRICSCPPSPTPAATPTPTITPPAICCHTAPAGMQDVTAIVVAIAVIDPKSKALLDTIDPTGAKLKRLNGNDGSPALLTDWGDASYATQTQWQTTPGLLRTQWRAAIDANSIGLPQPAISGIRVYERTLYLSPPTLNTP